MSRSGEIIELLRALGERMDRLERLGEPPAGFEGADPEVVLILTALKEINEKLDRLGRIPIDVRVKSPSIYIDPITATVAD